MGTTRVLVWVDRAGVAALARVTGVLVRVGLPFTRLFGFALDFLAIDFFTVDFFTVDLRAVERALPLTFRRDAAAFNCFPLLGLWPRRTWATRESIWRPPTIWDCNSLGQPVQPFFR